MKTKIKPAKDWRFGAPGSKCSSGFFLLFIFVFSFSSLAQLKVDSNPYVPNKRDYSFELGTFWEEQTFLWVGANIGFHVGECPFFSAEKCQSYLDFLAGFGLRDNDSANWLSASLRWQLMNYPSPWSQFFRLMGGVSHSSVADRSRTSSLFGVGYGATRYLHKNLDLRAEVRLGYTHQIFTQTTIGLEIKVDDWVESFVKKIKDLGLDAVHGAGEVLSAPFRGQEQEKRTE